MHAGLVDYKFYCFNGEPKFLYVSSGLDNHATAQISFVTLDWNFANFSRSDYKGFSNLPPKPKKFEEMIEISKKLSENHDFLRVDLYEIDGIVFFSELTFSPNSGFMPFTDTRSDIELGKNLTIRNARMH